MSTVLLALVSLIVFLLYHFVVRPLGSPLAKVPAAHWSCHVFPFWILRARKNRAENRSLHEAHRRHGPVVRVGPNEISVDGADMVRAVYQGGFEKDGFYSVFDNYGVPCMFSSLNSKPHSLRKRMISHTYSKSYIQASLPLRLQTASIIHNRLLPILASRSTSTSTSSILTTDPLAPHSSASNSAPVNVHNLFLATSMDFISAYIHGLRNATNFLQDEPYRTRWLGLYNARNEHHFWPQEMPRLTRALGWCGVKLVDGFVDRANEELAAWNWAMCERTKGFVFGLDGKRGGGDADGEGLGLAREVEDPVDEAVVFKAIHAGIEKESLANGENSMLYHTAILQRDKTVASELFDHVLAGQETSGTTLTYLTHHLSRNPSLQARLRAELLTLDPPLLLSHSSTTSTPQATTTSTSTSPPPPPQTPNPKSLDALPLLHATLLETLRLNAPIPGPQPRTTPHPSCTLHGHQIPGGVRVAALAHTLHRDERVFEKPDEWLPERWLSCDEEQRREMMRWFWAFGSGGRMCIGSNFAMQAMKYIVAAIYTNFTTSVADDTGIEQGDGYTARPASDRLFLRFQRVDPNPNGRQTSTEPGGRQRGLK